MELVQQAEVLLRAGYTLFPLSGKVPIRKGWQNTPYDVVLDAQIMQGYNYGVMLREDDLVIDIDPRHFPEGRNVWKELQPFLNTKTLPETPCIMTGGGGMHIYYKKDPSIYIKETWEQFPGIEFKSKGRYVVGPCSVHPETKKLYKTTGASDFDNIAQAPETIMQIIKTEKRQVVMQSNINPTDGDIQAKERFVEYLKNKTRTEEFGKLGDKEAFIKACRGRDFGLTEADTLECMLEHWAVRRNPPWEEEVLAVKVRNAYEYNEDPIGLKHPAADFKEVPQLPKEENNNVALIPAAKWELNVNGTCKVNLKNTVQFLTTDPNLQGLLRKNELTGGIEFTKCPPWEKNIKLKLWSDHDEVQLKFFLTAVHGFDVPVNILHEAAIVVSHYSQYHPIKEYFNTLKWDRVPRIDNWLHTYCGAKNDKYTQFVGRKTLLAAIARIYRPGCKFDHMLVLEGAQGIGKSSICAMLGKEWYGDPNLDVNNKDTVDAMRGIWIVEVSEMECATKSETNALKAFLTRQVDRVRLAYGRSTQDFPRQSVFIGTINPENAGYLKDGTGNRRFWPVLIDRVDFEDFKRDVDQLWAETVSIFLAGENIHMDSLVLTQLAAKETEKRRVVDDWEDIVANWLALPDEEGNGKDFTTGADVWTYCFEGNLKSFGRREQLRISNIMLNINWVRGTKRGKHGRVLRGYIKGNQEGVLE